MRSLKWQQKQQKSQVEKPGSPRKRWSINSSPRLSQKRSIHSKRQNDRLVSPQHLIIQKHSTTWKQLVNKPQLVKISRRKWWTPRIKIIKIQRIITPEEKIKKHTQNEKISIIKKSRLNMILQHSSNIMKYYKEFYEIISLSIYCSL